MVWRVLHLGMANLDRVFRSNLKLRHLQLVVALDEFRHLGRTAEFLSVSQPAVSRMLVEVENMLALKLFDRSPRGTVPTEGGQAVLRFARGVLAQYERTREELDAALSGAAGKTRVGAMAVTIPVLLADAVQALKARYPRATVLVEEGDLTRLLPKLRLGELDVFVGRLEPGYAAPDLVTEPLFDEPMVAVVAPGSRWAAGLAEQGGNGGRGPTVTWADLALMPCVMPPPWASLRVKVVQQFHQHGVEPSADQIETSSYLATLTFVRARDGVGFVAKSAARRFEQQGLCAVLPLEMDLSVPAVGLITLRDAPVSATTQQFIECLRQVAG